jgi:hypothetical protein
VSFSRAVHISTSAEEVADRLAICELLEADAHGADRMVFAEEDFRSDPRSSRTEVQSPVRSRSMNNDNEAAVRNAYAVAERKDLEAWIRLFTPDGVFTDNSVGASYRGRALADPVRNYAMAFSNMHRELYHIYADGNVVVVQLALQGTHDGRLKQPKEANASRIASKLDRLSRNVHPWAHQASGALGLRRGRALPESLSIAPSAASNTVKPPRRSCFS